MSGDEFNSYFLFWKKKINAELLRLIPLKKKSDNRLKEAIRYTLHDGGKRLRPILCIAGAEAAGGSGADVLPFACAIELIHTYSLIHDDLPCMDNADTRRGKPACHKAFNESIAVLTGDALLTEGFRIMTDNSIYKRSIRKNLLRAANLISKAAGLEGMIEGQVLDVAVMKSKRVGLDYLKRINLKKTAMLISASAASGAILVSGTERVVKTIQKYGINLGMAFQLMDDLIDIERDEPSIPAIYGDEVAKKELLEYIKKSRYALKDLGRNAGILNGIIDYIFEGIINVRSN